MIKIENVEVVGWEPTIRGMRNPKNSWHLSDSDLGSDSAYFNLPSPWVGPKDKDLMMRLAKGGPVHAKYRRMIVVYLDITAPLYWWKEFDTYKVGTVANSCSTMHKLTYKEFELDDFSHEKMVNYHVLKVVVEELNRLRKLYLEETNKQVWYSMIQLLPTSYNQKRTIMLSYEVLVNMYKWRKNHKLDEWRTFCEWIETLPYAEIITCPEG